MWQIVRAAALSGRGLHAESAERYRAALDAIGRDVMAPAQELSIRVRVLSELVEAELWEQALVESTAAVELCASGGLTTDEAEQLEARAMIADELGRVSEKLTSYRRLVELYEEIGSRAQRADARMGLGRALRSTSEPAAAEVEFGQASDLYAEIGQTVDAAIAHAERGDARRRLGDTEGARSDYAHAADLFERVGDSDMAHQARARIDAL